MCWAGVASALTGPFPPAAAAPGVAGFPGENLQDGVLLWGRSSRVSQKAGPCPVNCLRSRVRGSDSTVGTQGRSHLVGLKSAVTPTRRWRTGPTSCLLCGTLPACASWRSRPVPPPCSCRGTALLPSGISGRHRLPALRHLGEAPPARPQASWGAGFPPLERRLAALCPSPQVPAAPEGQVWWGGVAGTSLGAGGPARLHQLSRIPPRPSCSARVSRRKSLKIASDSESPCPMEASSPAAVDQTVSPAPAGLC